MKVSLFWYLFKIGKCGENQVWSNCANVCEPQCENFRGERCLIFTQQCIFKCICKPGYVRIEGEKCIEEKSTECGGRQDPLKDFIGRQLLKS